MTKESLQTQTTTTTENNTAEDLLVVDADADVDPNNNNTINEGEGYESFDLYKNGLQLFYDGKYKESIDILTKFCILNGVSNDDDDDDDDEIEEDEELKEEELKEEDGSKTAAADGGGGGDDNGDINGNGDKKEEKTEKPEAEAEACCAKEPAPVEPVQQQQQQHIQSIEPCILDEIYTENNDNTDNDNGMVLDTDYINISLCTITLCHERPIEIKEAKEWFNSIMVNAEEHRQYNSQQHMANVRQLYFYYKDFSSRIWYEEKCYSDIQYTYGLSCGTYLGTIAAFTLAIDKDPMHVPSLYRRGLNYLGQKEYKLAKIDFVTLNEKIFKIKLEQNKLNNITTTERDRMNYDKTLEKIQECDKELHPYRKVGVHLNDNEVDDIMKMFHLDEDGNEKKTKEEKGGNNNNTASDNNSGNDENNTGSSSSSNNKKSNNKKGKSKKKKK